VKKLGVRYLPVINATSETVRLKVTLKIHDLPTNKFLEILPGQTEYFEEESICAVSPIEKIKLLDSHYNLLFIPENQVFGINPKLTGPGKKNANRHDFFLVVCDMEDPILPVEMTFYDAVELDRGAKKYFEKISESDTKRLPEGVSPEKFIQFTERLYTKNMLTCSLNNSKETDESKQERIPKIIHMIWLGGQIPKKYNPWRASWHKNHPGWKFIFWSEEMIKKEFPEGLINQESFDDAKKKKNYGRMSDIARYEILDKLGGVYLDCDVECFEKLDSLNDNFDFYAGLEEIVIEVELGNAIIGARKGHPVVKRAVDLIKSYESKAPEMRSWDTSNEIIDEVNRTLVSTGPVLLTKAFWEASDQEGFRDIVFPAIFLYASYFVHPCTLSKHYFHDLWIPPLQGDVTRAQKSFLAKTKK
jgi:mannosyltransferase OCH1-like enzyme